MNKTLLALTLICSLTSPAHAEPGDFSDYIARSLNTAFNGHLKLPTKPVQPKRIDPNRVIVREAPLPQLTNEQFRRMDPNLLENRIRLELGFPIERPMGNPDDPFSEDYKED